LHLKFCISELQVFCCAVRSGRNVPNGRCGGRVFRGYPPISLHASTILFDAQPNSTGDDKRVAALAANSRKFAGSRMELLKIFSRIY